MCDNRWKFKRIIKKVFCILKNLKLEIAYEKTMIGRTKNCFDFLGFSISRDGLRIAKQSVQKLAERIIMKLDSVNNTEKGRAYPPSLKLWRTGGSGYLGVNSMKGDLSIPDCISKYVQRWLIWVKSVYGKEKTKIYDTAFT